MEERGQPWPLKQEALGFSSSLSSHLQSETRLEDLLIEFTLDMQN